MHDSKFKLARAREHLITLGEEVTTFIKNNKPTIEAGKTQEGDALYRISYPQPSERIGILASDVFQNLRASLDYLAWELAKLNAPNGEPHDNTIFPICGKWNSKERKNFETYTQDMTPDMKDEILALQPYKQVAANKTHPLWTINTFCNVAKHRCIPNTGIMTSFDKPTRFNVLENNTVELIYSNPPKGFKPKNASWTISFFSGIREHKGITLRSYEVNNLYNYVTEVIFPRFVHFFK